MFYVMEYHAAINQMTFYFFKSVQNINVCYQIVQIEYTQKGLERTIII